MIRILDTKSTEYEKVNIVGNERYWIHSGKINRNLRDCTTV